MTRTIPFYPPNKYMRQGYHHHLTDEQMKKLRRREVAAKLKTQLENGGIQNSKPGQSGSRTPVP